MTTSDGETKNWKIIREADDPLALRLSIGSPHVSNINDDGYIVYRGDTKTCIELLENALAQFKQYFKSREVYMSDTSNPIDDFLDDIYFYESPSTLSAITRTEAKVKLQQLEQSAYERGREEALGEAIKAAPKEEEEFWGDETTYGDTNYRADDVYYGWNTAIDYYKQHIAELREDT